MMLLLQKNRNFEETIMIEWNKRRTCIIAEAGVNHNGDVNIAKELCLAAKKAGADVVKFQTWITEKIITKSVKQAEYQVKNTNNNESQYNMLKRLELSFHEFVQIKEYCDEIGIQFASTADEIESLDFLIDLGIPFIKVGSGDIGNIPFLRYIGRKNLPIIMSTGMSSLEDIDLSLKAIMENGARNIALLHCTTNYPCPYEEVNLNAIETLKEKYNLPVGYSDHTIGIEVPIAAVAKGASIIEKHFTLDRNMKGPDHLASTEPHEFHRMVQTIRNVEKAFGNGIKEPTESEKKISKVVFKRIVAKKPIMKGEIIREDAICVKRNEVGILANKWDDVVGMQADRNYNIDEGIDIGENV